MSCDSVFHQYLQSIAEFWPVRFSLALSLAPASSGFCNSLTNKLFGVGGGGRNRTDAYSFCRAVPYHLATPPIDVRSINEFPRYARASCSSVLNCFRCAPVCRGGAARGSTAAAKPRYNPRFSLAPDNRVCDDCAKARSA